ncbi:hypothetical protein ACLMAL_38275, partial [Nocardia sp. CWNU-33]|uniref:hypothetical protein n=1 Tax=Nocardia sp. CWNU-33 TaxID=3392117 RepID=UPI00398ED47A
RDRDRAEHAKANAGATAAAPGTPGQATQAGVSATPTTPPPPVNDPNAKMDLQVEGAPSQEVTREVAQAVKNASSDPTGDAQAAWQAMRGDSSGWPALDPGAQLRTGDVVEWEFRKGVIVQTETGWGVVSNNHVVPLNQHVPQDDGHGQFGQFLRFSRPTDADQNAPGQTAAAPPAIAAPATPPRSPTSI